MLGMEHPSPTIDDILDRVLVSHDWMGERFANALEHYPDSMLYMFSGITAIVIDADIRPAHYNRTTGAIYLDPDYLWQTEDEHATINQQEDYRAHFADALNFRVYGRYITSEEQQSNTEAPSDSSARSLFDITLSSARLLLHELSHANDFLPRDSYYLIDKSLPIGQTTEKLAARRISMRLKAAYPLRSKTLDRLAKVMFWGDTATTEQRQITADTVVAEFIQDSAINMYSYSTQYEDLAKLFDTVMMKKYWGVDYQIAIVTPSESGNLCDGEVSWSVLNWIGDESVKVRAKLVTDALLPEENMDLFYDSLPAPEDMTHESLCNTPAQGLGKPRLSPLNVNSFVYELPPEILD